MNRRSIYIEKVLSYLNESVQYALLRNYEGLPHDNTSRDIDIVIERKEFRRHRPQIVEAITNDGWQILSYLNNGRLITYVCARIYGDVVDLVQWDLFMECSVHGILLMSGGEMVASREFNGVLYHVSKEYEFLDKYLYNRAVGAQYPLKYSSTRAAVESSEVVALSLAKLFGCSDMSRVDHMSGRLLLIRTFLRNPLSIITVLRSLLIYIVSYLRSDTAPQLAFTGPDGVGKTTIITLIEQRLSAIYGTATQYYHFRPMLIPNLGEAAHNAGIKCEVDRAYDKPHRGVRRGVVSSFLRLCYYTIDYIFGYWIRVKPNARITKLILFDRYYNDVIVDSRRSSIYLKMKFLYYWGRVFIPKVRYNFLITASPEIILSRKQELEKASIERINNNMEYLTTKSGYYLIVNNNSANEVVTKILTLLIESQHRSNLKRV